MAKLDLEVGQKATRTNMFTREHVEKYAEISGDRNPLHFDEGYAAKTPFGRLVVHPAAGHREGTLVHGLLHHCGSLADLGGPLRPGIVHRLDKNTSGVLVIAKCNSAYRHLCSQFKNRVIHKEYSALVYGRPAENSGTIRAPMHRHHRNGKKMGVVSGGREALTTWWVDTAFSEVSLLNVVIETGRTHQIRVHLAHLHHPVVGDSTYGGKKRGKTVRNPLVRARLGKVRRQMLHARTLVLQHPTSEERLSLTAPLPEDMNDLLGFLGRYASGT